MHWPLRLEESKDFCPISNRNFLPVPSKSAGRSCMIKYALTIFIEFWFTMSAVSYFSSCSCFRHTEHIKESLQICYTSPRCSRYVCGLHILLYHGFVRKMVYYIQYHQKGTTASFTKKKEKKRKSNISVCCNTDNMTGFCRSVIVYGLQMIFELL